jgi:signal recognition particle subunit SRP54
MATWNRTSGREEFVGARQDRRPRSSGVVTPGQALIAVVQRELAGLMGGAAVPLNFATTPPAVVLLAGLQGAGKTTSAAKLARLVKDDLKKKVLLVSCDVYRPAAIAQLQTLAAQVGTEFFLSHVGEQPLAIANLRTGRASTTATFAGRLAKVREITQCTPETRSKHCSWSMRCKDQREGLRGGATRGYIVAFDGDARGGAASACARDERREVVGVSKKIGWGVPLDHVAQHRRRHA